MITLKDLKFDECGTTGMKLPGGEWLDVSVVFDPENPVENKFSVTVFKPPTVMETTLMVWHRTDLHPLQAQSIIVHLTNGGDFSVLEEEKEDVSED
jgi:hypothetical protein